MRHRLSALIVAIVPAMASIWLSEVVTAQAPAAARKREYLSHGTRLGAGSDCWGDPDFQGIWSTDDSMGVPIQRPDQFGNRLFLTDEEIADRAKRDAQVRQRSLEETAAPAAAGGPANTGPPSHWGEQGTRTARQTSLIMTRWMERFLR